MGSTERGGDSRDRGEDEDGNCEGENGQQRRGAERTCRLEEAANSLQCAGATGGQSHTRSLSTGHCYHRRGYRQTSVTTRRHVIGYQFHESSDLTTCPCEERNSREGPIQRCGGLKHEMMTPGQVSPFMGQDGLKLFTV